MRTTAICVLLLATLAAAAAAMDAAPHKTDPAQGTDPEAARRILQAFADELTAELSKLDDLMAKPCPGTTNYSSLRESWTEITGAISPRWTKEKDGANQAYWRTKHVTKDLPEPFLGWAKRGEAAWDWLNNNGVQVYAGRKFLEMQTDLNKRTNVPNCAIMLAWLTQQAQVIDKAVGDSGNIWVKGMLQQKIDELEQLLPRAELVEEAHRHWSRETSDFLKKFDPDKLPSYKKLLDAWMPEKGSDFEMIKQTWSRELDKAYRAYKISHEAVVTVADPIIEGDFLSETNHIKHWKPNNLAGELRSLIANFKQRLKTLR